MANNAKRSFLNWYTENSFFLKTPLASQEWDKQIANEKNQKAIISSKKVRKIYKQTEAQLIHDYTDLVDAQLRRFFQEINIDDVANPVGFSERTRGSDTLQNYFNCRETIEWFIGDDISGHGKREAKLHAFRRWIDVANLILHKHQNYEALSLILMRLFQLDTDLQLSKELPETTKEVYETLSNFLLPSSNFKRLREHMQAHAHPRNFMPTFLLSKDLLFINEVLSQDKKLNSGDIDEQHRAYHLILKKEEILAQFVTAKSQEIPKLEPHLVVTFELISEQYSVQSVPQNNNAPQAVSEPNETRDALLTDDTPPESSELNNSTDTLLSDNALSETPELISRPRSHSAAVQVPKTKTTDMENNEHRRQRSKSFNAIHPTEAIKPTNLFTQKLLPSFWQRGCSEKRHWEKLYDIPVTAPKAK